MLGGNPEQLATFIEKFETLYKESFPDKGNLFMFQNVVGSLLLSRSSDPNALSNNYVGWAVDSYVGMKLGPQWERYLALHQFLVSTKATAKKPFSFEHCDRFGVAFADEEDFKTMAIQTQNYTYMVLLSRRNVYTHGDDAPQTVWAISIRVCTSKAYEDMGWAHVSFKSLTWLAEREKVSPEVGYGKETQDYFRYKDGRDRGYCITIEPDIFMEHGVVTYRTEHALSRYLFLDGLTYDLASHCDCIDDYKEILASNEKV